MFNLQKYKKYSFKTIEYLFFSEKKSITHYFLSHQAKDMPKRKLKTKNKQLKTDG